MTRINGSDHIGGVTPLKVEELRERCMGNASVALLLLEKFESQLRRDSEVIATCLSSNDGAELARIAHSIAGAAGTMAAGALYGRAAEVDRLAREASLDAIAADVAALRSEVERCLGFLPAVRRDLSAEARPEAPPEVRS
ncbi:MAG: Hpt domain-containing protein [Phycisphaeraceae bacterium]|nr:Hpt domain-containing protein [Phycisphaeraceae bacterium]